MADIVMPAGQEDDFIYAMETFRSKRISVSSVEILALNSSPKLLIAAPGAGKVIVPIVPIVATYAWGSVEYTGGAVISYGPTDDYQPFDQLIINDLGADKTQFIKDQSAGSTSTTNAANKGLYLRSDADPEDGDSTLVMEIVYRIIDLA